MASPLSILNACWTLLVYSWSLTLAVTAALAVLYYFLVQRPWSLTRDVCDVGFDYEGRSRASRIAAVRREQRRRVVGSVPPVFPNGWFALLESCRLAPGQVQHVAALGQNFAVFRAESGDVHVLDAYCPHLGANMALGGRVSGDCLTCPFHEWKFDGRDGSCVEIPYAQKVPASARTRRWECCESNGFVFLWHHAEGEAPRWRIQPVAELDTCAFAGRNDFLVSCHIQDVPENGADAAHFNPVHGHGMGVEWLSRHVWSDSRWAVCEEPGQQHMALLSFTHRLVLAGKLSILPMNVRIRQIGPGYVEMYLDTPLSTFVILQTVLPLEPLLQRVVHRVYSPPLALAFGKMVLLSDTKMFERDVRVINRKRYERKPLLVEEDMSIKQFRRWYAQFYSTNSPTYSAERSCLDW